MALIVLALIVVGIMVSQYYAARRLFAGYYSPRNAMLVIYIAGVLDCIAVLLIGFIAGSLLL